MDDPIATIVITTRDRPDVMARALASALAQTLSAVEVLIVDDGSCEPLRLEATNERVRVVRLAESQGVSAARNEAIRRAKGTWLTFLDDDDELLPTMLENSIETALRSPLPQPVSALSGVEVVDASGRVVEERMPVIGLPRGGNYFFEDADEGDFGVPRTLVAPREVLIAIGGWDPTIRSWEDSDFGLRLNKVCSLVGVRAVGYRVHLHATPHLRGDSLEAARGIERTLRKHRATFGRYRRRHAHYLGAMGVEYLKAGRWGRAVAGTSRAVVRDPRQGRLWLWWAAALAGPRALRFRRRLRRRLTHSAPAEVPLSAAAAGSPDLDGRQGVERIATEHQR